MAALYAWQVHQLNGPILIETNPAIVRVGGELAIEGRVVTRDALDMATLEWFERQAYREALANQRKASLGGPRGAGGGRLQFGLGAVGLDTAADAPPHRSGA